MGIFAGLTANGLRGAFGRSLIEGHLPIGIPGPRGGASPIAAPSPAARAGLLDHLRKAFDPQRIALIQATLAGDYGAVSRMTEPLRRQRLARRAARKGAGDPQAIDADAWSPHLAPAAQADAPGFGSDVSGIAPEAGVHEAMPAAAHAGMLDPFGDDPPALGAAIGDAYSPSASTAFHPASFAHAGLQDAFDRQLDRRQAERIARETGRDPQEVYEELRPGSARIFSRVEGRARAGADAAVSSDRRVEPAPQSPPDVDRLPVPPNVDKPPSSPSQPLRHGAPGGWLAEERETSGRGARTISSGVNDPGGASVGRYQLRDVMLSAFLRSELGAPWRRELQGLEQGSTEFRQAWNRIVDREGDRFDKAQYRFLHRENYVPYGRDTARQANFSLAAAHPILQEVVWSGANNMGGPQSERLATAVERADQRFRRDDPRHQEAVIDAFYDEWADRLQAIEADQRRHRRYGQAETSRNIWSRQLPAERARAIGAYRKAVAQR